jgi:hypothetical protein
MHLAFDREDLHTSHLHCNPYNPAFFDALPAPLRHRAASGAATMVLRRLTVGFGYLPSWASPRIRITADRGASGGLPEIHLSTLEPAEHPRMLGSVLRRLPASPRPWTSGHCWARPR